MLRPLVVPFTTTEIVLIFLIFFLFQREDLRDESIRLAGSEDLERTTAALDDAAGIGLVGSSLHNLPSTRFSVR